MDRRKAERKLPEGNDIKAYVYYKDKKVKSTTVKDASAVGLFLKGNGIPVPLGAVMKVVVTVPHGNLVKTFRRRVILTRLAPDGIGVGFLNRR